MSNDKEFNEFLEFLFGSQLGREILKSWDNFKEEKSKEPKPLFTTEDGKEIFEGDDFYYVPDDFSTIEFHENAKSKLVPFGKAFWNIGRAKEWILMNKPVLSINDFRSCTANVEALNNNQHYNRLVKLAQQKIDDKV